jgi:hypothetical protein
MATEKVAAGGAIRHRKVLAASHRHPDQPWAGVGMFVYEIADLGIQRLPEFNP